MSDASGKKISDLRVIDLRLELEKRGLDRNGIKGVLIERLTQALVKEGVNPDNYIMEKEAAKPEVPTPPTSQGKLNLESTTTSVKVKIEPPLIELEDDEGQTDSYDQVEGGDAIANDEEQTDSVEVNDDDADVDADAEGNVGEDGDAEGIPDKTVETGDVETGDVEVDEADINNDNEEANENDGAGKEDESGYECSEEQEDKFDEEGGNEEEQEGDEDLDEKEDEELDTTENNNESVEEVLDDDLDEDALHLTIGDDEEEDKNYILDEEREKDKTGDKKDVKEDLNVVACSDKQSETADISQNKKTGTAKVKTAAKKETKGVKLTPSAKVKQIKSIQQTAASSPSKEGKSLAVSASKKDEKGGAGEPAKPDVSVSEKRADSHSAVKVKVNKNLKEKDGPKKDVNKGPIKDVRSEVSKKIDNRRINPKNRFPRTPYEKPIRIPMNRPKQRRSMSPRMRRPSFPIHQQRQTLSFEHIREMRERERQREREREMHRRMRERERREREEIARQREIERRNAEQLELLERERQRLRVEREKVEREKEELIRMERERQRAERERIEREKEEIRRAKLDDRNRRNQKRSFDEERDDSREYVDRKKLVTAEARRLERPYHEQQLQHVSGSSRGNNITPVAAADRREPEAVRHERERGHHHRSDSRGFSPVRETIHGRVPPRPPIIHDRGASARDWRYSVELQKESHHREKEPVKEKRSDDRRQMRVAREREIPSVASTTQKARIQTDYNVARNDSAQHHRNSVLPKGRGTDRFDVGKNEPSYAIARDDSWMRRYDTPSTIQVTSSQSSIPLSGRDNWMPAERKLDWSVNDRISVRPSMPEMQDRWISGSGGTLNSALRTSSMATGHIGQLVSVPPVIYNQHAAMTISGDSISSQPYSSDRYSAYGKQSMHMRRY